MRPRSRRRRGMALAAVLAVCMLAACSLSIARAVLYPRTDSPERVDAVVVVAGARDDRYRHARRLAEEGRTEQILVSRPREATATYGSALDSYCSRTPFSAADSRRIDVECFSPDMNSTEGEATAAVRIAHERGYNSLLVVTYWGHVSRVRMYFEQCFEGELFVTDTPQPSYRSRKAALMHETGGYIKALINPAC